MDDLKDYLCTNCDEWIGHHEVCKCQIHKTPRPTNGSPVRQTTGGLVHIKHQLAVIRDDISKLIDTLPSE